MYYKKDWVTSYLKELSKEIEQKYNKETLETIYIGGGTPSSLDKENLKKLFEITNKLNLKKKYEFTFECNVNDINETLLKTLKENKVNRLSIGVETFNKKYLDLMNRKNTNVEEKIKLCKKYFKNISIDLIYGIKGQTLKELEFDLNKIISLDINHISIYCLILEENTILKVNNYQELEEEKTRNMYDLIRKKLKEENFIHYEISNFAKKGYESRHNLTYWKNEEYYGFGLGASGFINNTRYENTRSLNNYLKGNYIKEEHSLSKKENMENEMILGLRMIKGVSKQRFKEKFDKEIKEIFPTNNLKENKDYYYISKNKLFIENSILIDFILD